MTEESPQTDIDPFDPIATAFAQLTESAKEVNRARMQLARPVSALQTAIKNLNLEVTCWLKMAGDTDSGSGEFWREDVGYARHQRKWAFVVRESSGNHGDPFGNDEETWFLNEAPQHLRLKAIDKLPELLEAMVKATDAATKRIAEKVAPAEELAGKITALTNPQKKKQAR